MEQQYDLQTIAVWLEQIGALAPLERTVNVTDNDDQSKVSPVETLQQRLQDGIALCKLLNHIRPDTIININLITDQHDFAAHDNLNSFISGCEYYLGIEQNQLFEVGDVKSNDPEKWMKVIKVILALEAVASANGKTPRLKDITIADGKYDSRVPSLKETLDSNRTIALYSYEKTKQDELSFEEGEIILIVSRVEGGWWEGQKLSTGEIGWFPSNYVQDAPDVAPVPSPRNSKDKMPQEDSMARTIFLRDFLRSEMNFYESLHSFVENVVEFLALEENMIVFPSTDHMIAFGRIYDILSFHMRFIGEFEKCLKEKYQDQLIGKLFSDFVESFTDVFSAYCTQYSKAVRVISKYKSDEKFASCLRKAYDNPSAMKAGLFFINPPIINIMSWLVKPTQRLPKYVKFLQDLIKITSASHPDAAILPGAEVEFNHAFQKIMSIKKLSENREILGDISGRIDGWEGPALEHYGELIMDGSLRIIKGDHKSKERYFFLLDKILVCLQKNAPKPNSARQDFVHYKLVEVIPMNNAAVNLRTLPDNNSAKNVFQINFNEDSRQKSLVLSAVSPELKQKWLHSLQRTLENNAHYSFPAIPQDLSSEIKSLPQETLKSLPSSLKRFLSTRVKGKSYKKVVQRSNESIFDAKKDPVPDVPKKAGLHNILATFLPSADRPSSSASKISSSKNSEDSESKNAGVDAKPKRSLSLLSRSNSLRQAFKGFGSNNVNTEKDKSKELIKTASGTSVTRGIQNGLQRALTVSATSSKYKDLASKYKRKTPMPTNDKNFIAKVQEAANEHYASETSRPTSPEFLQSPISNVPELEPAKDVLSPVVNVPENVEDKSVLSLQPVPSRITFIDKPKELVESDAKVVTSGSYRLHVESVDESTSSNTYPVVSMISTVPKSRAESTNIARSASTTTLMEQTTTNYGPSLSNLISKLEKNLEEFSIDLDLTKELSNRQLQTLLMFSLQKHFEALERIEKLEQKVLDLQNFTPS